MGYSRAIFSALVVVCCAVARVAGQSADGVVEQVPLFPTRQPSFDIPFQIDEPIPGQEPVEVQLHTSDDRGATWKPTSKVSPDAGRFSFRAPKDGEYWFLVRTLNKQGKLLPDRPFAPEMKVLVDTEPPRLELSCNRGAAGEVYCTWKSADPYLKPETLLLTYQGIDGGPQWQTVAVAPSTQAADGTWSGRTTFVPLGIKWPLFARMEVSDVAGNRATAQIQIESGPGVGPQSLPLASSPSGASPFTNPNGTTARADGWQPGAASTQRPSGAPAPFFGLSEPPNTAANADGLDSPPLMSSSFPNRALAPRNEAVPRTPTTSNRMPSGIAGTESLPTPPGAEAVPLPFGSDQGPLYRPASKPLGTSPRPSGVGEAETLPAPESLPAPTTTAAEPARRTLEPSLPKFDAGPDLGPTFSAADANPLSEYTAPRETQKPSLPEPAPLNDFGDEPTPPGVNPRMVNSRRFELEYDVESTGSGGVAKVELWATRDAGRTWTKSSTDPDATSPYLVSVDEEGIYGFRIVIETSTGVRSPNPQPGDLPEIWVGIDVTKPTGRIVSVQQRGDEQGVLLDIRWEADDRLLPARPVSLSFAETADGPWTTIVSGLPNTHSYDWRFDSRTPERIFVKLDVKDVAGNAASFVTAEPVIVERVRPAGRIRGIRPVGESARLKAPSQILPR